MREKEGAVLNFVKVVNNVKFQSSFAKSFLFEGGRFVCNTSHEKQEYLFNAPDAASTEHNRLIEEGVIFYKWDTGALFLLWSHDSDDYPGTVFYVDSECSVYAVGNTPFNLADKLGDSIIDVHSVIDKNAFFDRCQVLFGNIERHFSENEAESSLYSEYPDLE